MKDQMVSTWSNFAMTGDPTPPSSKLSWLPVSQTIQDPDQQWFLNLSGRTISIIQSYQSYSKEFKVIQSYSKLYSNLLSKLSSIQLNINLKPESPFRREF